MDILNLFFGKAKELLLKMLPLSPFTQFLDQFAAIYSVNLGWLNWLVPVRGMLTVMAAWLAAVTVFYMYSIIARWVKIIGD